MKKLIIFTTLFVLCLVFLAPGALAFFVKFVPYNDQPGYSVNNRRSIYFKNTVTQEFTAQDSRLTGVGITIGNPNLKNKKEVIFELFEGDTLVRTSIINGQNIPDGEFVRFVFDPIVDSKGKNYTFKISSSDARDEEVLYVYFTDRTPDWVGDTSFIEGEVFEEGKLSFVTYHKPESRISLVVRIYSCWLSKLIGRY